MEGKYCDYLLFSKKINKFYIGKTSDINRRFVEHTLGEEKYTRNGKMEDRGS
jgi:putative endonuclease